MMKPTEQTFTLDPSLTAIERHKAINELVRYLKHHKLKNASVSISVLSETKR